VVAPRKSGEAVRRSFQELEKTVSARAPPFREAG
jgi:hypothetical protein